MPTPQEIAAQAMANAKRFSDDYVRQGVQNTEKVAADSQQGMKDTGYLHDELSSSNLLPWQKNVDQGAIDLAKRAQDRISKGSPTAESFRGGLAFGGGKNPMSDALSMQANREGDQNFQNFKTVYGIKDKLETQKQLGQVADVHAQDYQQKVRNYQEQLSFQQQRQQMYKQYEQQKSAVLGNILGTILGLVGMGAGFMIGGPAGGSVGKSAGGAIGGTLGGSIK